MPALIFDFDGVLVDSEPLHEWAIRQAVAQRGWTFTHEQFISGIVGRGDERAFATIAGWNGAELPDSLAAELLTRKRALMADGIRAGRFEPQPGAVEAVRKAASRGPVAVCSGSVAGVVLPMLEAIGVREHIGVVVTAEDMARPKPAPDGYLLALERLGLRAEACMAVEDTPTGVASAKAAGLRVLAVCHTCPRETLREADHVVDRLANAARLLDMLA